ncbi:hypothetical protein [Rhizobium sp. RAF56]|uniref:hypothetical protein n=1 Tax=Rhizobium sp. RAF56 TaxID=3233062 RepID=UPI003F9DDE0F
MHDLIDLEIQTLNLEIEEIIRWNADLYDRQQERIADFTEHLEEIVQSLDEYTPR